MDLQTNFGSRDVYKHFHPAQKINAYELGKKRIGNCWSLRKQRKMGSAYRMQKKKKISVACMGSSQYGGLSRLDRI